MREGLPRFRVSRDSDFKLSHASNTITSSPKGTGFAGATTMEARCGDDSPAAKAACFW